jgi:hypothetical protein
MQPFDSSIQSMDLLKRLSSQHMYSPHSLSLLNLQVNQQALIHIHHSWWSFVSRSTYVRLPSRSVLDWIFLLDLWEDLQTSKWLTEHSNWEPRYAGPYMSRNRSHELFDWDHDLFVRLFYHSIENTSSSEEGNLLLIHAPSDIKLSLEVIYYLLLIKVVKQELFKFI